MGQESVSLCRCSQGVVCSTVSLSLLEMCFPTITKTTQVSSGPRPVVPSELIRIRTYPSRFTPFYGTYIPSATPHPHQHQLTDEDDFDGEPKIHMKRSIKKLPSVLWWNLRRSRHMRREEPDPYFTFPRR